MFEIEKNVPIPVARKKGEKIITMLKNADVGDSFIIEKSNYTNIWRFSKNAGVNITTRNIADNKIRVWIIKRNEHA